MPAPSRAPAPPAPRDDAEHPQGGPDLRVQLQTLWRRKWILLACVVVVPLAVFLFSSNQPNKYQSTALVQVQPQEVDTSLFVGPSESDDEFLNAAARITKTTSMARLAARRLKPQPRNPRALLRDLTVTPDQEAGFLTIAAVSTEPRRAADIANAFATALRIKRTAQARAQIDPAIAGVRKNLDQLQAIDPDDTNGIRQLSEQLQRLRAIKAAQGSNVQVVEPAIPAAKPAAPRPIRDTVLAFVLALLGGIGLAFLIEGLDRRIRDVEELERLAGVSLLSIVPLVRGDGPRQRAEVSEAFQTLRASLTYFNIDRKLESVIVVSPVKGDGKTTVSTNVAKTIARAGQRVIVIDMDMRHPQVDARLTNTRAHFGLGAVLVGERSLDEALIDVEVEAGRLQILPSGPPPPNPSELISSQRMRSLLIELCAMTDLVIIDSPPTLLVSDTIPLFKRVSGIVVVSRLGKTTRDSLRRLLRVIRTAGGMPLGIVATSSKSSGLYGYGAYGGGYGAESYTHGNGGAEEEDDLDLDLEDEYDGDGHVNGSGKRRRLRLGRRDRVG